MFKGSRRAEENDDDDDNCKVLIEKKKSLHLVRCGCMKEVKRLRFPWLKLAESEALSPSASLSLAPTIILPCIIEFDTYYCSCKTPACLS